MSKSNLYKTLYRHFQRWEDYRQRRVVYNNREEYEVRVIEVVRSRVDDIERRLIKYFKPVDNTIMYEDTGVFKEEKTGYEQYEKADCPF